jgi:antitoxin HicB
MSNKTTTTLDDYLALPYTIILQRDEDGDVVARIKELDGCVADGENEEQALIALRSMKKLWLEMALKKGASIPKPETEDDLPSGKWLQRVPRSLHKKLADLSKDEGVSLNQLVTSMLSEAVGLKNAQRQTESNLLTSVSAATGTDGPKGKVLTFATRAAAIRMFEDMTPSLATENDEIAQATFVDSLRDAHRRPTIQWGKSHSKGRSCPN